MAGWAYRLIEPLLAALGKNVLTPGKERADARMVRMSSQERMLI
jgi:hypothetical protein